MVKNKTAKNLPYRSKLDASGRAQRDKPLSLFYRVGMILLRAEQYLSLNQGAPDSFIRALFQFSVFALWQSIPCPLLAPESHRYLASETAL